MFFKDTIMSQVIRDVKSNEKNFEIIEKIEMMIEDINDGVFLDYEYTEPWNKKGMTVIESNRNYYVDMEEEGLKWSFFETIYAEDITWLLETLNNIYKPFNDKDEYRLFSTIGFMLSIYLEKMDDIQDVLRIVTYLSIIWLHESHIKDDQFMVEPIRLPEFGKEF